MILLIIIYCIIACVTTYLFMLDICDGYFKNVNFSVIILLYILCCPLWPIGLLIGVYDEYFLKNKSLIKSDEKENKRKIVCEVLEELKIR